MINIKDYNLKSMKVRTKQVEVIVFKMVDGQPLFLLLKRNPRRGGFWQPVTGGVHDEEELADAAKRELLEETQIDKYLQFVDDVHYFEFDSEGYGRLKEYVFGVEVAQDVDVAISPEHTEMKWCTFEESLELLKYDTNKEAFKKLYDKI